VLDVARSGVVRENWRTTAPSLPAAEKLRAAARANGVGTTPSAESLADLFLFAGRSCSGG
jgi:hypothetical protein